MSNSFLLGRGNLVVGKSTIDGLPAITVHSLKTEALHGTPITQEEKIELISNPFTDLKFPNEAWRDLFYNAFFPEQHLSLWKKALTKLRLRKPLVPTQAEYDRILAYAKRHSDNFMEEYKAVWQDDSDKVFAVKLGEPISDARSGLRINISPDEEEN